VPVVNPPGGKRSFWSVLPLSKAILYGDPPRYVNNGVFQLPLLEGSVPKSVLSADNPFRALLDGLSLPPSDKGHLKLADCYGSVCVAIQNPILTPLMRSQTKEHAFSALSAGDDGLFKELPREVLLAGCLDLRYLKKVVAAAQTSEGDSVRLSKFQFDAGRFSGIKRISEQLSTVKDLKKLMKSVNKSISEFAGISLDAI
jgi:hypothetical protein